MTNASTTPCKILVAICTCLPYLERRQAVRETWLQKPAPGVHSVFFAGGNSPRQDEPDLISLDVSDHYDFLPAKVLSFFRYAVENFEFEWLFKCDDDTYVVLQRLLNLGLGDHGLAGNADFLQKQQYASGGAGYLVSRKYAELLAQSTSLPNTGCEDIIITKEILRLGAKPLPTQLLGWDCSVIPNRDNAQITAHWCQPRKLHAIHTILHQSPSQIYHGRHRHWTDRLSVYPNGIFHRHTTPCAGLWEPVEDGKLRLKWFDWKEEIVEPVGLNFANNDITLTPVSLIH